MTSFVVLYLRNLAVLYVVPVSLISSCSQAENLASVFSAAVAPCRGISKKIRNEAMKPFLAAAEAGHFSGMLLPSN